MITIDSLTMFIWILKILSVACFIGAAHYARLMARLYGSDPEGRGMNCMAGFLLLACVFIVAAIAVAVVFLFFI